MVEGSEAGGEQGRLASRVLAPPPRRTLCTATLTADRTRQLSVNRQPLSITTECCSLAANLHTAKTAGIVHCRGTPVPRTPRPRCPT